MNIKAFLLSLALLGCTCADTSAKSNDAPPAVCELVRLADPHATVEYCGALSYRNFDYYLFALQREELSGLLLVRQKTGEAPVIFDADTSFSSINNRANQPIEKLVLDGIDLLVRKRNLAKRRSRQNSNSTQAREVSSIGDQIDRVVYPLCGFRLGSNSTREILRRLQSGPAIELDPKTAPPGSIIVSPTRSSPFGPVYLGHAGIVGSDGSVYSADARAGGAWSKNFSLAGWLQKFSGANGCYAFVLRAQPDGNAPNL
jgi:hypothetical protein